MNLLNNAIRMYTSSFIEARIIFHDFYQTQEYYLQKYYYTKMLLTLPDTQINMSFQLYGYI